MTERRLLLDASALPATIRRLAGEILDRTAAPRGLVGIRRGGEPLSLELARAMKDAGHVVAVGSVDIALYRDDASSALPDSKIGPSRIEFPVDGADVILVDDVLQTGRTVRAAIDALLDYGRPRRVWLATLLDRGGRELPIAADFVGQTLDVAPTERVLVELDGPNAGAWAEPKRRSAP